MVLIDYGIDTGLNKTWNRKQDVVRRRKEREIRDMKRAPGIDVHCVARKREGLALVSVARAEP